MLTSKQHELLLLIEQRLKASGISPSFDEMKEALGLKSKSGVHRLITALVERGFIRRLPNRARALEVLRMPDEASPRGVKSVSLANDQDAIINKAGSNVVRMQFPKHPSVQQNDDSAANGNIPLHGKIAAGLPIEALEQSESVLAVPLHLLGRGDCYALEVDGDSMLDAGILSGDYVIIERSETARDGEIVVALIDQQEATLKRFKRRDRMINLEPCNRDHITQTFEPGRVKVQGRLVGLMRKY